jgi:hypothetical protein
METEQSSSRELTPSERRLAIAMGIGMLLLSLMALVAMVALYLPLFKITEGLSK